MIDHRFGAQSPVSLVFQARRQAGEILHFELTGIGRILELQRRNRAIDGAKALVELFRHRCPRAGTEDLLYLVAIEGNHVLQHEAGHQLNLKAVAEQPCERPRDADPMMDRASSNDMIGAAGLLALPCRSARLLMAQGEGRL